MPVWGMDDWQYLERQVVADPKGRQWSVALMDVLGQAGDPDRPNATLELQYTSGRYFTLIYSGAGRCSGSVATLPSPRPHARTNGCSRRLPTAAWIPRSRSSGRIWRIDP